jgi:hypothetical protein
MVMVIVVVRLMLLTRVPGAMSIGVGASGVS